MNRSSQRLHLRAGAEAATRGPLLPISERTTPLSTTPWLEYHKAEGSNAMRGCLAGLFFVLVSLSPSAAGAWYCGNRLVLLGQSQREVLYTCGEPDTTERRVSYRRLAEPGAFGALRGYVDIPVVTERWVYNFGPQRVRQELWFEEGRLVAIQPLGY